MDKVKIINSSIRNVDLFSGDALMLPVDVELSYRKVSYEYSALIKKAAAGFSQELADIGYCDIGHAVIVQGYNLTVKKLILMPVQDRAEKNYQATGNELHQAIRSAFDLARLYKLTSIGFVISKLLNTKRGFSDDISDLSQTIINEHVNSSINELYIYR